MKNDQTNAALMQAMATLLQAMSTQGAATKPQKAAVSNAKHKGAPTPPKAEKTSEGAETPKTSKSAASHTHHNYMIESLPELYALADAELLDKINSVRNSVQYPGTRIFFVDKCPETEAVLKKFKKNKNKSN